MTPTEQDKELREELYRLLKTDPRADTYVIPYRVMDIIVDLITADRKRVALEARIDEISHVFRIVDGRIFWQSDISLAMPLEERIAELKGDK